MSNAELILVKVEEERIEFDIGFREEDYCEEATSICSSSSNDHIPSGDDDNEEKNGEEINGTEAASKAMVVVDDHEDDDDGFKTPTSMDHKIPEMKQCPAAPRKPKANKRNLASSTSNANASCIGMNQLLLDLSQEVESWFPASIVGDLHRKVKKVRTQENQ